VALGRGGVDAIVRHGGCCRCRNVNRYHIPEPLSVGFPTQDQIRPVKFSNPANEGLTGPVPTHATISPYLSMTAFTFAMSGGPARVHDSRNVFEISLPRDPGCECYERAGVAGIKVVEAVHGASWYEQGVARFQSMRHPVERDCQRPAETIPNFFEIATIKRRRYCSGTVMSNIVSLPPFSASSIRNFSRSEPIRTSSDIRTTS